MEGVSDEFLPQRLAELPDITVESTTTFADMTTLHVGGRPRLTVHARCAEAAAGAVALLDDAAVPLVIVGGGSNLLVADGERDEIAVLLEFDAVAIDAATGIVRAEAGATWDDVVAAACEADLGGIECLSGIPGSAGAVPVQNVGAYGAEISDVLQRVRLFDRATGTDAWVPAASLELGYRHSNLKFTQRAVVLEIELQLSVDGLSKPLRFGQLTQHPGERRVVAEVRREVLRLRAAKGMVYDESDHDTWSAGSFFTNPVVSSTVAGEVQAAVRAARGDDDADRMPRHPAGTGEKLSAAWLIERAGFTKGYPGHGPATLSSKHTLALTNRGAATAGDIVTLARTIRDGVHDAFGIQLVPEPVWLGVDIDG